MMHCVIAWHFDLAFLVDSEVAMNTEAEVEECHDADGNPSHDSGTWACQHPPRLSRLYSVNTCQLHSGMERV